MQFLTLFLFFANNSRMEGPIPVFLTYLDLPNGLEGGSTANYFFWIFMLNKVCTAKREAILSIKGHFSWRFKFWHLPWNSASL